MANTTNFDLVKPSGSDAYNISSFHNGSMDKIDSALQGLGTGLAIISKGNTHAAVTKGQFVYVHGHDTLAEGMYKASSNIAANATLSSSNLTAASGGLGAEVASLSDQIGNVAFEDLTSRVNVGANVSNVSGKKIYRIGNTVFAFIRCSVSGQDSTILSGLPVSETSNMELMGSNAYMSIGTTTINAVASFTDKPILIIYSTST